MNLRNKEVKQFLKTLDSNNVKYMLVGGIATIYHGHTRSTTDLDLWIKDSPENKKKLVSSLKDMNVPGAELYLNVDLIPGWSSIKIGEEGFEADLMGYMKAFKENDFDTVYERSIRAELDDVAFRVINLNDLIVEKKANARPKDLADIKGLTSKNSYMGIEVTALSKMAFQDILDKNSITSDTIENYSNVMFISILDTGKDQLLPNAKNYLNLTFDDVEVDIPGVAKTMSKQDAQTLNEFLKVNKTKKQCFIHCSAGVSRSGSIGKYIVDELEGNQSFFMEKNPHLDIKRHFLKTLEECKADKKIDRGRSSGMKI